jgi:cytochrome bd-type quinol oxidase subunit 2
LNLKRLEGVSVRTSMNNPTENHMRVIQPSCTLPSLTSPGCGCAPRQKAAGGKAASAAAATAGAAALTALAAAACTACCVLPFTLPAVILAGAGGFIAVLDHAHGWVTRLAVLVVICAWLWIGWQVRKTKRRASRLTVVMMVVATLLTAAASSWPVLEPIAFHALGIAKKRAIPHNE